jgi:hypothetical protein
VVVAVEAVEEEAAVAVEEVEVEVVVGVEPVVAEWRPGPVREMAGVRLESDRQAAERPCQR